MICPIVIIADLGFSKLSLLPLSLRWRKGTSVAGSDGSLRSFQGLPGHGSPFAPRNSLGTWSSLVLLIPSSLNPAVWASGQLGLIFQISLLVALLLCPGSSTLFSIL